MVNEPDRSPEQRRDSQDSEDFFGVDLEGMSPRTQAATSLTVLLPVTAGVLLVLLLAPSLWWLIFVFGWMIPACDLLVRGVAGLSEGKRELSSADGKERELLGALRAHGGLTPAQAAMETSLTVAEADRRLEKLADGGHLQVSVRGGGLLYSLWEVEGGGEEARRLENR